MNFSVNFMSRATAVLKEAFALKKYKAMPLPLAIVVGVLMLPLVVASLVCALFLYVMGYIFSISALPVQSLHKLMKEEGQDVRHGTQVIIYLASWGFVFTAYALLTFLLVTLTVLYSVFSIFTYLWSLGGFKFHLFASEEDIAIEVDGKYNNLIPVIYIGIMAILWIFVPVFSTIFQIIKLDLDSITVEMLFDIYKIILSNTGTLRFVVSAIYSAIFFAPFPRKQDQ